MRHLDASATRCGRSSACICRRCGTGTDRFSLEWSPAGLDGHRYRQTLSWQDILNGTDNAVIYLGHERRRALSENDHDRGRQRQQTGGEKTIVLPERLPAGVLRAAEARLPHR
jgi:hypothetical protein